jgi:hypothetical protein
MILQRAIFAFCRIMHKAPELALFRKNKTVGYLCFIRGDGYLEGGRLSYQGRLWKYKLNGHGDHPFYRFPVLRARLPTGNQVGYP